LQNAPITQGDTVLNVGCGYGPLAFGALPLVREQGEVLFCDVSPGLLEHYDAAVKKQSWGTFLNRPFYPFFPPLRETIQQALTATEAEQLTNYLRPLVEAGQKRDRWAGAYLQAVKHQEAL